jgi:primosomal protein N' (replication factor Y)
MERRAGKFRAQLLLSSRSRKLLQQGLDTTIAAGEDSPLSRKVRWSVDVDPVDLF